MLKRLLFVCLLVFAVYENIGTRADELDYDPDDDLFDDIIQGIDALKELSEEASFQKKLRPIFEKMDRMEEKVPIFKEKLSIFGLTSQINALSKMTSHFQAMKTLLPNETNSFRPREDEFEKLMRKMEDYEDMYQTLDKYVNSKLLFVLDKP